MLTPAEKTLLFLDSFAAMTYAAKARLCALFGTDFAALLKAIAAGDERVRSAVGETAAELKENCSRAYMESLLKRLEDGRTGFVTLYGRGYPPALHRLNNPPFVLYTRGDASLLLSESVSVVGSRDCSPEACRKVKSISQQLAEDGLTVISGLADGADRAAHEGALAAGGKTIAVLAGGVDHIYPASARALYAEIERLGLIVSEKPPGAKPIPADFLIRNRIVAGLSGGTLITFAKTRSGTRVTAEHALECGSELMILPGAFDSPESEGCNLMIRELQGAAVIRAEEVISCVRSAYKTPFPAAPPAVSAGRARRKRKDSAIKAVADSAGKDYLKAERGAKAAAQKPLPEGIGAEAAELLCLLTEKRHIGELCQGLGRSESELSAELLMLEIDGHVCRLPGNFYVRT